MSKTTKEIMSNVFKPVSTRTSTASLMKRSRIVSRIATNTSYFASFSTVSQNSLNRAGDALPLCREAPTKCSSLCRMRSSYSSFESASSVNIKSILSTSGAILIAAGTLLTYNGTEQKNISFAEAATKKKSSNIARHPSPTPATVHNENVCEEAQPITSLPVYTSEQVRENDGTNGKPIWMTYGGVVYDVTNFIPNHPGGSEKIMLAAGSAIEPHWHVYRQHFSTDLPIRLMEDMIIGRLDEKDQKEIDSAIGLITDEYAMEPKHHAALKVHSDEPMNAETPTNRLTDDYLTPAELFFIRNHHPVPNMSDDYIKNYSATIDLSDYTGKTIKVSLDDIKKMEKVEIVATLQCSRNRADDFNEFRQTSSHWDDGAISTAKWGGVRLKDLLSHAGLGDPIAAEKKGFEHVCFEGLDGMMSSIRIDKAVSPYGDCILAYEMNGKPLKRDHGFPLRLIVPGYVGVRNVKWVSNIRLSRTEADGPWQRGLNYKILPPSITDAKSVNLDDMPSVNEGSIFSGITKVERCNDSGKTDKAYAKEGDSVLVKASGWAWAGGGRNIVRVDLTGDGGKTWSTAEIVKGGNQKFGRAWAWVLWSCEFPATVGEDEKVEVCSKAVDIAFNAQPSVSDHNWNVRGLCNNSWFRTRFKVN